MPESVYISLNDSTRELILTGEQRIIGVYGDNRGDRKLFRFPRYVGDNLDIAPANIYVNFRTVSGKVGQILCVKDNVNPEYVDFSWPIPGGLFDLNVDRFISFAVRIEVPISGGETIVYTTKMAAGECRSSIQKDDSISESDLIVQLLDSIASGMLKGDPGEPGSSGSSSAGSIPTVYCWGDSLTEGVGGWISTPDGVQKAIFSSYPDQVAKTYPCVNLGCRGETIQTIMARQGSSPMLVGPFTIPSDPDDDVVIGYMRGDYYDANVLGLMNDYGEPCQPLKECESGINPCYISGVKGTLFRDKTPDSEGRYAYRFARCDVGSEVEVSANTPIETFASKHYRNGIAVIWMGANGAVNSHTEYISRLQRMIEFGNYNSYLVLMCKEYAQPWVDQIKNSMTDANGVCHFLYLKPELLRRGYALSGINFSYGIPDTSGWSTTDDILKNAPLLHDSWGTGEASYGALHYSPYGYKAIGKMVVEKLVELIGTSKIVPGDPGNNDGPSADDIGYSSNGTDSFGFYHFKLTKPMTRNSGVFNTQFRPFNEHKDWTIYLKYRDSDIKISDLSCLFEMREFFPDDSKSTAVAFRLQPDPDHGRLPTMLGGFGGFNFPWDSPGYAPSEDGYHYAVIAKNGGMFSFYFDGGLSYGVPLGYAVEDKHLSNGFLYLFGRVENGNVLNTCSGTISDFRVYEGFHNSSEIHAVCEAMKTGY